MLHILFVSHLFSVLRFLFLIFLSEKEEINEQKVSVDESLCALKDCKRAVEIRYKNILIEISEQTKKNESLTQQNLYLETSNTNLQQQIQQLESEKNEQTEILAELQQNLIFKSSEYENQIRTMQIELGNRLDEINVVKKEDVNKVKGHYMELFQEKASEVMILRDEAERLNKIIDGYKTKVKDLEYREEELNNIVNKMREGKMTNNENDELQLKLKESFDTSQLLQEKVNRISEQFREIKEESSIKLHKCDFHIDELQKVIRDKDIEIEILRRDNGPSCQVEPKNTPEHVDIDTIPDNSSHKIGVDNNSETSSDLTSKYKKKRKKKKSKVS